MPDRTDAASGPPRPEPRPATDLAGLDRERLREALSPLAPRDFVPGQIYRWLYHRRVSDFHRMTDLPSSLRDRLTELYTVAFPPAVERTTDDDGTTRYVFALADGERTEAVAIPGDGGQLTLCLSSQVGCPLACAFCLSGVGGVKRNLTTAEILGQARAILAERQPPRRTNIVFMGMGEALLNFDNLVAAFAILADPEGLAVAWRRMTVSTAGHVPAMTRFGSLARRPRLAVSLNATTDELRDRLMPVNRRWPLGELLAACRRFPLRRGERITFEYVLLAGVNDHPADARRIPHLLAGIPAKVNLIPWNAVPGFDLSPSPPAAVEQFAEILRQHGKLATVRRRRGAAAGAACGQLTIRRPVAAGVP